VPITPPREEGRPILLRDEVVKMYGERLITSGIQLATEDHSGKSASLLATPTLAREDDRRVKPGRR
jgi:hypothetical protein